jgi:alkanesulfonate monooxygenase SsuD/methylene tetrahydromethanopterin reductase-like flavin-dependent oxidoreductase (luciferase family)
MKGLHMAFSLRLTPKVESILWGAAGGAAGVALIGFAFGGWVTGGKANEMAQQRADKAVITALAPICADKFRHANNAQENFGKLNAISYSWEKGNYVSQGG